MTAFYEKKLITIASGKGGVGKTWLSSTLAHTLSRMGRSVLLFDGDLGLANIDIQLGLMPEHDIGHVINGGMSLEAAVTRFQDEGFGAGGFDVLAGRSGSGALSMLSRERLVGIRDELTRAAGRYDHVILDLAAGVEPAVMTLAEHGGAVVVVMTPDPTSLTDAYAFVKLLTMRNRAADVRILVNNAPSRKDGERAYGAILKATQNFLKLSPPLAGIVKSDPKVMDAIRHQMPLLTRHPQADAAEAVALVARGFPLTRPAAFPMSSA